MMASRSYHQTQVLTQTQLTDYELAAKKQEGVILKILKQHPRKIQTAEDLIQHFAGNVPITSIRRALTNLSTDGLIEKCGQVPGTYGRPINQYRYRSEVPE